jgi:nicotinamide mononucleotide transporter
MAMGKRFDTLILGGLTLATAALAAIMLWRRQTTSWEAASFVTGAVCVWLTVKENVWNFPIGLANNVTFCVVFFGSRLFADASLQIVYFVLGVIGWYLWLYGGEKRTELHIARAPMRENALVGASVVALTVGMWQTLHFVGGSASFWDALTTAISLGAQWLLNKKRLETWFLWILADVIYVPLYVYKHLYLTAFLYAVFLVMAVMGYWQWRERWKKQKLVVTTAAAPALQESAV